WLLSFRECGRAKPFAARSSRRLLPCRLSRPRLQRSRRPALRSSPGKDQPLRGLKLPLSARRERLCPPICPSFLFRGRRREPRRGLRAAHPKDFRAAHRGWPAGDLLPRREAHLKYLRSLFTPASSLSFCSYLGLCLVVWEVPLLGVCLHKVGVYVVLRGLVI